MEIYFPGLWGRDPAGTPFRFGNSFQQGGFEHAFRGNRRTVRTDVGSAAVPPALRPPDPAVPRPARPNTAPARPGPPRPHRRPGLRPGKRDGPPRRPLGRRPHHRIRPLARHAGAGGEGLVRHHPRRGLDRLPSRRRRPLDPHRALRPDRLQRGPPMGAQPPRVLRRLDRRTPPRRHPRLPGPRQLHLTQPRPARPALRDPGMARPPRRPGPPLRPHPRRLRLPHPPHRPRLRDGCLGDHVLPAAPGRGPRPRLGQGHGAAARPHRPGRRPGGGRRLPRPVPRPAARGLPARPVRHGLPLPVRGVRVRRRDGYDREL